jgi:hypothetical protein
MPAGELKEDGTYPEGSINYLVMKRLTEISAALKEKKEEKEEEENKGPGALEKGKTQGLKRSRKTLGGVSNAKR